MSKDNENYQITKNLSEKKLKEICNFFKSRNLQEFELIENDQKIILKATPETQSVIMSAPISTSTVQVASSAPGAPPLTSTINKPSQSHAHANGEETHDGNAVPAPISGTFYASPSPDDPPYIEVGDKVKKGDKLCIVEAMKAMNEIESPHSGQVVAILATNGMPIKQGDTMVVIK